MATAKEINEFAATEQGKLLQMEANKIIHTILMKAMITPIILLVACVVILILSSINLNLF